MNLPELHRTAREIFNEALLSVDSGGAVRRAVQIEDGHLKILDTTFNLEELRAGIYSIAIGKAAHPMASALAEILGNHLTALVESGVWSRESGVKDKNSSWLRTLDSRLQTPDSWLVFAGGHPLPNLESLEAARAAFDLLRRAERVRALLIFLISGGGSAMMEWPRNESVTLEELQETNRVLVSCGASIAEINAVRRAISAVKGGGLARRAPHCNQVSLIISDTGAGEEVAVASGPTFEHTVNSPDLASVIARYDLESRLPASILRAIKQPVEKRSSGSHSILREHYVLLENSTALESAAEAARSRGFTVEIARDAVEQPVDEGCSLLLYRLFDLRRRTDKDQTVCLISGGEFACPVRGRGFGGRNAESALRWAIELDEQAKSEESHAVALSAGTDGIDGNSPAAGAVADETSVERARLLKMDAQRFLDESDAYTFFQQLNDAIVTGPTGTNVRDLRIMLAS
ncbi:MAG TPA: DUF4147 domain-containing protein [Pyrinomonadaceae bacterium]|nr:DUF4147 domain-containing protein [Pyrinomonadaceae bacterium]